MMVVMVHPAPLHHNLLDIIRTVSHQSGFVGMIQILIIAAVLHPLFICKVMRGMAGTNVISILHSAHLTSTPPMVAMTVI